MTKKIIIILIILLSVTTSLISIATVSPKDISVAIYPNEPLVFYENDTAKGLLVDILNQIALEENWNIKYEYDSFANGLKKVESSEVDLMLGVAWSKDRERVYNYSEEALFVNWGQIYQHPLKSIESIQDLSGSKIGVMSDDIHYVGDNGIRNTLKQFSISAGFYEFQDKTEVFDALEKGVVDAAIVNRTFGMENANQYDIKKSTIQLNPVTLRVVSKQNFNDDMLRIIDGHVINWKNDENSIYHNRLLYWFDSPIEEKVPTWLWIVLGGCVVLLAAAMTAIYFTQKIIQSKTSELLQLNETLENKVKERTHDLDESNDQLKVSLIALEEKQSELEEMNAILEEQVDMIERAQDRIIESEKMASLGRMVSSLAHELNTPLGVCVTLHSNMKLDTKRQLKALDSNTLTKQCLTEYLNDVDSVADMLHNNLDTVVDLVDRFKMLSSDRVHMNERKVNMNTYLNTQMESLSPELKQSSHDFNINCPEELELVVDPSALSQVIRNLTMNSLLHGFENKKDGIINIKVKKRNDKVLIEYADNGKGIQSDIKNRIFEPFFTTKRNRGGTGLGLSIVHSAVTQTMGGEIRIDERIQNGLKYEIELPYRDREPADFEVPNLSFKIRTQ